MQWAGSRPAYSGATAEPLMADAAVQDASGANLGAADGTALQMAFHLLPLRRRKQTIHVIGDLRVGKVIGFLKGHSSDSFGAWVDVSHCTYLVLVLHYE